MLEKSNTWPEQVLETLNSCWRALLESCSNTQSNVRCEALHTVPLGLEGRSKFKELLAAGAPRHPIGRFRPRRPGGSGTFSNFELWAPEVAF